MRVCLSESKDLGVSSEVCEHLQDRLIGGKNLNKERIKEVDCTIRDGGHINNHYFSDDFVRAVYQAISETGIDYLEIGYRGSRELFPPKEYGDWKYSDDDKINQIVDGIESNTKLSIMVDTHRIKAQEFAPVDKSPVDMERTATYVRDIDKA